MGQLITCCGCGSVWEIDNDGLNQVKATLVECPLCFPEEEPKNENSTRNQG